MAVETLTATGAATTLPVPSHGYAANAKVLRSFVEVSASASVSSTYNLHRLPSAAKIHGLSTLYWDDMATTGAPTLDVGTVVGSTYDDDSVNDGLALATASTGSKTLKAIDDYGDTLWSLAGESADPGGEITIRAKIKDAAVTTGGTLVSEVVYSLD